MKLPAIPGFARSSHGAGAQSAPARAGTDHRAAGGTLALFAALTAAAVVACSIAPDLQPSTAPDGSPAVSPSPAATSPGATSTPGIGEIDHPTGATDVVVRFEEGGGFVPAGFFATEAPIFTLYGDGTVIFRDATAAPPPDAEGIGRMTAFRTARLSEDEIQAFLARAVADGGLGVARAQYVGPGADLPTATFTLTAGDQLKTVSVTGLGLIDAASPDAPVLRALADLGEQLRNFGPQIDDEGTWKPERWRGVLTPDAINAPRAWPWSEIEPADFVRHPEPGAPGFPVRTMSTAEIDALGLGEIDGGFSGLALTGPDGKAYTFALRPLFPDEAF
ncbi:MAG: hypothetical protein AB1736_11160 [Chloroflexota bacterium]